MSLLDTTQGIMNGLAFEAGEVPDIGTVLTRWSPVTRKRDWLDRYMATIDGAEVLRGIVIFPGTSFKTAEPSSVGGYVRDVFNFAAMMFSAGVDEDEAHDGALERVCGLVERWDNRYDYEEFGFQPFAVGPTDWSLFGYGHLSQSGVWLAEMSVKVRVDREVDYH